MDAAYLELAGRRRRVTLERVRRHRGAFLIQFAEITTRSEAEQLRGAQLRIPRERAAPLKDGEYFWGQIVGLEVVTTGGESLGPITQILQTGANDVYVTARALIPAIADVVKEVDCERGRMVIEAIPGLLEADGRG